MTRTTIFAMCVVGQLCVASLSDAQAHEQMGQNGIAKLDASTAHLIDEARIAADAYSDRRVAIAAGYRRVGRDLPSMGEHWINPKLIIDGTFDISRPQILMYLNVEGRVILTGVVYAIPLRQGESPPGDFGSTALWHEHNGTIDDEALLPQHHSVPSVSQGTRVAFLHVWTGISATQNIFAAENWAIPFVRLGLPIPVDVPNGAARALSLLTGKDFVTDLLGEEAAERVAAPLATCARAAETIARQAKMENRALTGDEIQLLDADWQRFVAEVARLSGVETAKRINGGEASIGISVSQR